MLEHLKPANIRLLGDPVLRAVAASVDRFDDPLFAADRERLYATLMYFRKTNNFGRAISAPQIGCGRRLIALFLNGQKQFIVNPRITWASEERFSLWDDCMSFPSLLVKVERSRSISIKFQDETGEQRCWERLDIATSELLQHEIDHLDGILAIDRAIDKDSVILRDTYAAVPDHFRALVDYEIESL